jgi:hypothetical protein
VYAAAAEMKIAALTAILGRIRPSSARPFPVDRASILGAGRQPNGGGGTISVGPMKLCAVLASQGKIRIVTEDTFE